MRGNVEIILRGDWSTEEQYTPFGGPTVGAKAIGETIFDLDLVQRSCCAY